MAFVSRPAHPDAADSRRPDASSLRPRLHSSGQRGRTVLGVALEGAYDVCGARDPTIPGTDGIRSSRAAVTPGHGPWLLAARRPHRAVRTCVGPIRPTRHADASPRAGGVGRSRCSASPGPRTPTGSSATPAVGSSTTKLSPRRLSLKPGTARARCSREPDRRPRRHRARAPNRPWSSTSTASSSNSLDKWSSSPPAAWTVPGAARWDRRSPPGPAPGLELAAGSSSTRGCGPARARLRPRKLWYAKFLKESATRRRRGNAILSHHGPEPRTRSAPPSITAPAKPRPTPRLAPTGPVSTPSAMCTMPAPSAL